MKKTIDLQSLARRALRVAVALALCFSLAVGTLAGADSTEISAKKQGERSVSVYVNGTKYAGKAFIVDSVTYVGLREFSMHMGVTSVSWDGNSKTATVRSDSLSLSAKNKDLFITANGRYLWAQNGIIIRSGTMYVPLRTVAKAFGCGVTWDKSTFSAHVTKQTVLQSGSDFYKAESLLWLARIIHAEAQGESLYGKVAVGTVVLNRVKSPVYPNSVYDVVFDRKNGVQFTPVANGAIYCTPSEESYIAAKLCLDGASISDRVLFFVNEALAQSSWVSDNRPFVVTVGNHDFYA